MGKSLPVVLLLLVLLNQYFHVAMAEEANIHRIGASDFVTDHKHMEGQIRKYQEFIEDSLVSKSFPLDDVSILETSRPSLPYQIPDEESFSDFTGERRFGGKQRWFWFRGVLNIDSLVLSDRESVELEFNVKKKFLARPWDDDFPSAEGMMFLNEKEIGAIDNEHTSIPITKEELFAMEDTIIVHVVYFAGRCDNDHHLPSFSLKVVNDDARDLFYDIKALLDIIKTTSGEEKNLPEEADLILRSMLGAVRMLDVRGATWPVDLSDQEDHSEAFYKTIPIALTELRTRLSKLPENSGLRRVTAMGHAHIDACWLWPFSLTHHKIMHTFRTQVRLLSRTKDWTFLQSSPQYYKWLETDNPSLFSEVKELVKSGRWEPEGSLWCECDTNLVAGESLVRQLLHGKKYLMETFGMDSKVLWLPDAFGYSGSLPQIMMQAGVELFVTSKISWSEYNKFPHHTFVWKGIDGRSRVNTQFITTPTQWGFLTYNALVNAKEIAGISSNYKQKNLGTPLFTFGIGDGGGGPTPAMIEKLKRFTDAPAVQGFPKVEFASAREISSRLKNVEDHLPVWKGELYLEYHRGTYTSQAWLKREHRKLEVILHQIEWLQAMKHLHFQEISADERILVKRCWENVLLIEFHDSLPGSSVKEAYDEVRTIVEDLNSTLTGTMVMLLESLAGFLSNSATASMKSPIVVFNPLSWDRNHVVGGIEHVIPAGGYAMLEVANGREKAAEVVAEGVIGVSKDMKRIYNEFWAIEFTDEWNIKSILDRKTGRQVLNDGRPANVFQVFQDRPLQWDAWDINLFYKDTPLDSPKCVSVSPVDGDGVFVGLLFSWEFPSSLGNSTMTQKIVLHRYNPRIDFETEVNWNDHHQLLKVAFPVKIQSQFATYQTQFGHVQRTTHNNTLWDMAQFEVPAHRFVDLSEHGYGVSLLSNFKYGYDVKGDTMRITLLKSALQPDASADRGRHAFMYSLLPHSGSFQDSNIPRKAEELSVGLLEYPIQQFGFFEEDAAQRPTSGSGGGLNGKNSSSFVQVAPDAVVLGTIKLPFDNDLNGIVLRMFESFGSHVRAKITVHTPPEVALRLKSNADSVKIVDILEKEITDPELLWRSNKMVEVDTTDSFVTIEADLAPFEILSFMIQL